MSSFALVVMGQVLRVEEVRGINVVVVKVCTVGGGDGIRTIGGVVGREGSEGGMRVVDITV